MKLLLDIGNSNLKASTVHQQQWSECLVTAIDHDLKKAIQTLAKFTAISEIWFASSHQSETDITALLKQQFAVPINQVQSQAYFSGLQNGYEIPQQLGVDRWLAMIATWQHYQDACCVIDCGTCITYDEINPKGQHQGGIILPGRNMNHQSLAALLHTATAKTTLKYTANNTQDAISSGGNLATIASVQILITHFKNRYPKLKNIILTGGDAAFIAPLLEATFRIEKNIQLKGLLAIANSTNNG